MFREILLFSFVSVCLSASWTYWEPRSVDCLEGVETCYTVARNRDEFPCHKEPVADSEKMATACPLDCKGSEALSVTLKQPYTDYDCAKYYTYGQYQTEEDWFMWVIEPCAANLTVWCRFNTRDRERTRIK